MSKGKLIVIEGGDSSGKSTQYKLLCERLLKEGIPHYTTKFPRYGNPSAYFVEKMLQGGFGELSEQDPYRTSLFYTLDRYDAAHDIREALDQGKIVLLDRYTSANIGHQGGKLSNPEERKKYIEWLENMEYSIFSIPKPDKVFYLHMPTTFALKLLEKRNNTEDKRDLHELDEKHLFQTEQAFLEASQLFSQWEVIECVQDDILRSIPHIQEELYNKIIKLASDI